MTAQPAAPLSQQADPARTQEGLGLVTTRLPRIKESIRCCSLSPSNIRRGLSQGSRAVRPIVPMGQQVIPPGGPQEGP